MVNANYKELDFFKKAHELTIEIYKVTSEFPKEETYGLTSQLRRAAVSIGSNISEGSVRSTNKDWKNFLHNALGSAKEVEYQLLVAKDLSYISVSTYDRLLTIINEVIGKLINYMKKIE
jgi:four helix bundle protein